ncbi:MAG: hypothetical protein JXN59_16900 [Anaerolineae bacterium]|nr:hypothetical protein [Anaerolineae bacterium]
MTQLKYRALVTLGVIAFLTLATLAVSLAQQGAPEIDLIRQSSAPAAPLGVTVRGFEAGERVRLSLHPDNSTAEGVSLGEFVVEADGSFDAQVVLPGDWQALPDQAEQALILRATSADGTTAASMPLVMTFPETN